MWPVFKILKEKKKVKPQTFMKLGIPNAFGYKRLLKMTLFTLTMSDVNFV